MNRGLVPPLVEAAALLLDANGRARGEGDVVFQGRPVHPSAAVRHVSGAHAGALEEPTVEACAPNGISLVRSTVTDATTETAFVFGEFYRRAGGRKFRGGPGLRLRTGGPHDGLRHHAGSRGEASRVGHATSGSGVTGPPFRLGGVEGQWSASLHAAPARIRRSGPLRTAPPPSGCPGSVRDGPDRVADAGPSGAQGRPTADLTGRGPEVLLYTGPVADLKVRLRDETGGAAATAACTGTRSHEAPRGLSGAGGTESDGGGGLALELRMRARARLP